jgi:NAD(P)H dehydrogenase (quinone)
MQVINTPVHGKKTMKIGIIIYSMSGHTVTIAKAIAERFRKENHDVDIKLLMVTGMTHPGSKRFSICNMPESEEIDEYDALVFGGPVWLFKASPVILKFIGWLEKLDGKSVTCFVTQLSPWPSFGGYQALKSMNDRLKASGGAILPGESIQYFFGSNKQKLNDTLERIYGKITQK